MHERPRTLTDRPGAVLVRTDPRVKLIAAIVFSVCVVTTPARTASVLTTYAVLLLAAMVLNARVMVETVRKVVRAMPILVALVVLLPLFKPGRPVWQWAFVTVSAEGLHAAGLIFACGLLCVGAFALVAATTPEERLLEGLRGLGVPGTLVAVIGFMLRYLHVLRPELHRLRDACEARTIGAGGPGALRSRAGLLGSLFLRAFNRAERVGDAMAARGYEGQLRVFHRHPARPMHIVGGVGAVVLFIAIRVWGAALYG